MSLLVVAGDPSGDLHASHLIRAFKRLKPGLPVAAVGGPLARGVADDFIEDLASQGVVGFWEPLGKLAFLLRLGLRLRRFLAERRPAAVICVDYYGFNRRVLGLARAAGIPAFYYISPQVWASRPGRVSVLKRLVRRIFVIFPFEERIYREAGLPCLFVGHPLLDLLPQPVPKNGLTGPLELGLLPGSRASEVRRHLPLFLEAARRLSGRFPGLRLSLFAAPGLPDSAYALPGAGLAELVRESDYLRRSRLDLAFCSSGTATLENALLGVPMVVAYKLSWPTYSVARALVRVPHIAMANILAGRALVPELIQSQATPDNLARAALALLEDPKKLAALRAELAALRESLGEPGAPERAAAAILQEIGQGHLAL